MQQAEARSADTTPLAFVGSPLPPTPRSMRPFRPSVPPSHFDDYHKKRKVQIFNGLSDTDDDGPHGLVPDSIGDEMIDPVADPFGRTGKAREQARLPVSEPSNV